MPDTKLTPEQDADPFARVDKSMLENPDLSWSAKGLMAYLSGLPDGSEVTFDGLLDIFPDDADSIRAALDELELQGILP